MKKKSVVLFVVVVFAVSLSLANLINAGGTEVSTKNFSKARSGEIIVKYKNDRSLVKAAVTTDHVLKVSNNGTKLIKVAPENIQTELHKLQQNPDVAYAEPNYIRHATAFPKDIPNDPSFSKQWALSAVNAQKAWANMDTTKYSEIVVAVIDTGMDSKHQDLKNRVVGGYDFCDKDTDASPGPTNEEHASHVSGIIAAEVNNAIGIAGVAGVAPVKIMPLRVLKNGEGEDFDVATAINYAADHGARIINMSLGGPEKSKVLEEAVAYAISKNVLVIAAAGNDSADAKDYQPASIPGVVTVSSVAKSWNGNSLSLSSFSNYGECVEIAAPGSSILSCLPGSKYGSMSGTSMACPYMAGVAAVILSKNASLTNNQVEKIMYDSATDLGTAGKDVKFGYGVVNLEKALSMVEVR